MSIRLMTAIFDNQEVKGAARLVLLALADNANDEGVCWPSVKTIARKAAIDERRCHRIINNLEAAGYLVVTERRGGNGVASTNVYEVRAVASPAPQVEGGAETRVAPVPPGGGTETTRGVARVPPESSFNHQLTPIKDDDDEEKTKAKKIQVFNSYRDLTGGIPEMMVPIIHQAFADYGIDKVQEAVNIAAKYNRRNWKYIEAVLVNGAGKRGRPARPGVHGGKKNDIDWSRIVER